ncbi:Protein CBG22422 [Caenorhabditis briggsae]|uniref:Protein CBG22422 n=1 Tax=Caenorhabditis briggsae TaxID=6238 RepID=A8Y290_CAEBR|nr:Protein CBG22422 [Caenorhabditis briggsae]CAP39010.1 Protein CBG22422 [Caenorhabditis briggsae]
MTSATDITMDLVWCPTNMGKLIRRCIPKEMIPSDWSCSQLDVFSNLDLLRKMGKSELGMFRSSQDLFMVIANFLGVPGCANIMDFDFNRLNTTIPRMHTSLKGIDFVYKIDVFALASLVIPCPFEDWQQRMILSSIKVCQRNMELKWKCELKSHCEMVELPKDCLENFSKKMSGFGNNFATLAKVLQETYKLCLDAENVRAAWTDVLIKDNNAADGVYEIFKTCTEKYPLAENRDDYLMMLSWIGIVSKELEDFTTNSIPSISHTKATVRLFSVGKDNFVMAHELLQSLKNKNFDVSGFEEEVLGMPKLSTMEFREVARKVSIQEMKNIEFIRITQPETKLQATPIPSPNGDYCVRAIDAFHELLNDMIVAKKVFQTIEKDQFKHVETFFDSVKEYFCSNQGVYFISLEDLNLIKSTWEECYETKLKNSKQAKSIRNINGCSLNDLKKELEYLNLETCFPYIMDIAGGVYSKKKKTDMHTMIFQCQMIALSDPITCIVDFLHSQKVCTKWIPNSPCCGLSAELMTIIKKTYAELQAQEDAKDTAEATEAEKKKEEVAMEVPQKKKRSKKVKKTKEPTLPVPTSELTSTASESSSDPGSEIPEAKESQACPKCSRASHFADLANEKLRLSKVECKHLKKDLANAELEIEIVKQKVTDKDERIRLLEELLKSKDDIIERQNMDLLAKQDTILNMEMEMESKDSIIRENSTIIKDLEKSLKMKKINELEAQQSSEVRFMEPTRSDDKTEKVRDVLFKLLEIQGTLRSGNPIEKCRELAQRICMRAHNKQIEDATRIEAIRFCEEAKIYIQAVNTQLEMIRGSRLVKPEEIPELPDFPALSQRFLNAYENIFHSEAPKICESLLKTPAVRPGELADTDCLICIEEMDSEEGTIKCEFCKRRYHVECAQEWFKTKRTCPACSSPLLDDSEFPELV